jgi:predicted porin
MKIRRILAGSVPAVALLLASQGASAFGMMNVGDWQVEFGGNVNGFLTHTKCDPDEAGPVDAGLACGSFGADRDVGNIRTGLLPSWFGFHATQEKNGFKQGITIGFQPGIDSNTAIAGAPIDGGLGLNSSNFRQVFLEFSGKDWGGFKVGRDLGLFGSDAILSDMTLLGVGTTATDFGDGGGNTTLGRIGVGYVYADWKGQIQYTSPDWSGFQFSLAVDDPWGLVNLSGDSLNAGSFEQKGDTYGFEGKAGYTWKGTSLSGKVWASFIYQSLDTNSTVFDSTEATGFDLGGKIDVSGFEVVGYYYTGSGIGTTDFLFDALDAGGDKRDSDGYYLQASYKIPGPGTKIGISWGQSNLDRGSNDLVNTNLVKKNESVVVGIYHPLTDALYLVGEYTQTQATAHSGNQAQEDSFAFGAILFY